MIIRTAQETDLPAILEIYNHAILHSVASYDLEPEDIETRTTWFDDHVQRDLPILVAQEPSGKVVGWASLSRYHPKPGYRFTVEDSIYLAEGWRGQGIGRQLLAQLIELGRKRGLHAIIALIDASGEASIRLHESFGFETMGTMHEVGNKFDRWLNVVYMELILS
jgi:L-amino acid N-acyltransferase YncA